MSESIIFKKIENGDIFEPEYNPFSKNNQINFSKQGIAVIYGPNGTGKTSLVHCIQGAQGTSIEYSINGNNYTDDSQFYVVEDQNKRNIIQGEAKDFLLGDNIRKEYELNEFVKNEFERLRLDAANVLKTKYAISSGKSIGISLFEGELFKFIKDIANVQSKGKKYGLDNYIMLMKGLDVSEEPSCEENKYDYIVKDFGGSESFVDKLFSIDLSKALANKEIQEVEANTEAIRILGRFINRNQCVVCDTEGIDPEALQKKKTENRERILNSLETKSREFLEELLKSEEKSDPFNIKTIYIEALENGKFDGVMQLKADIEFYRKIYVVRIKNELVSNYKKTSLGEKYEELEKIKAGKPEIEEEDLAYIEEIISQSMGKSLKLIRDAEKNIRIQLEENDFLGVDRDKLPLSSGEQNFLSLTFEFLKAKNSDKPIVILDDPISSFDSIYKNKIAYSIIKILENKCRIILTHNTDLLRLLTGQYKRCFNLYLFNNTHNEENGFIQLKQVEQDMLINLETLINTFRNDIFKYVRDSKLFLASMIPFMRGYAMIVDCPAIKESLTQLMHGYKNENVDIAKAYRCLFGKNGELPKAADNIIPDTLEINVQGLLELEADDVEIVDNEKYPLLNRTLRHSFTYLYLRLLIEKALVEKYSIDTTRHNQLGQIISEAFPQKSGDGMRKRVMLTSKKTLLNEFNHFEGNLSIFQPAIDITDYMLEKEKKAIVDFVNEI